MSDLFDQLAATDVPPPPRQFDRDVHQRLNRTLVALHLLDLALRAVPWSIWKASQALLGFLKYTLTGRYDSNRRRSS